MQEAQANGWQRLERAVPWLAGGGTLLFLLIVLDVRLGGYASRLDHAIAFRVYEAADHGTRVLFRDVVAWPGDEIVVFVLLGLAAVVVALVGERLSAAWMATTGLGGGALVWVLKGVIGRARPFVQYEPDPEVARELGASYSAAMPSGHAFDTLVVYGLLVYAYLVVAPRSGGTRAPHAKILVTLWLVLTVVVGMARVLGGVHWPTDVLASWALGTAWLAGAVWVHRRWVVKTPQAPRRR